MNVPTCHGCVQLPPGVFDPTTTIAPPREPYVLDPHNEHDTAAGVEQVLLRSNQTYVGSAARPYVGCQWTRRPLKTRFGKLVSRCRMVEQTEAETDRPNSRPNNGTAATARGGVLRVLFDHVRTTAGCVSEG